ncbi:MAG TPA: histidine kinase dimerization/phospho-acceptor domain-containing protein, partial [Synergistaceae bacterium]|nr:histidine kinase dimerization/phospho-acceptor domain-containing protein [Synergistaceae bacterium]
STRVRSRRSAIAMVAANRISGPILAVTNGLHSALKPEEPGDEEEVRTVDEIARLRKELDDLLERLRSYEDEQVMKLTRLQARLAFVIEEVSEGLVLLDTGLNILGLNRIGREILKAGDRNGDGLNLARLDFAGDMKPALETILEKGAAAETNLPEIQSKTGDGEKTYRPRLLPFKSSGGAVDGYLLILWDVTEQKEYEESRRKFVSMLSHQLKTPVTSLSMSVNLIDETFKGRDEETDDLLRMVKEDCATLTSLVTELIEAARDMTPTLMLHRCRIDLTGLLKSALRPLVTQAKEKGIVWEDSIEETSIFTDADPVKFPWVVTNIVGNALRYTKEGGTVSLSLKTVDGTAEIKISDTG